jgi:hypothetical protein
MLREVGSMRIKWLARSLVVAVAFAMIGTACSSETTPASDTQAASDENEDEMSTSVVEVDGPATNLTRDLTSLLAGHEYHAGIALFTAVQAKGNLEDPTVAAAVKALDDNSVALSDAIGSIYGDAGAEQFLSLWRAHIGFFVDYTLGKATGDARMAKQAMTKLDGYRADFGAFIEGATEGGLTQDQVAEVLEPHVTSTIAAIDSIVAGDGKAFDKLQDAAEHLPHIATALAGAIVAQFPDRF